MKQYELNVTEFSPFRKQKVVIDGWSNALIAFNAACFVLEAYEKPKLILSHLDIRHVISEKCSVVLQPLS
jgi:hypothetical protein